jgi:hypothetical protein
MIVAQIQVMHAEQVNERYCGPAATQMVLMANGLAIETQAALFERWCHGQGDIGWASSPLGISRTLTRRMPERATAYQIATTDTEEALSRKLCWALFQGGVAVVLVNRIDHWIVVNGCGVSSVPSSPQDPTYTIDHFLLHDPAVRRTERSQDRQLLQVIPYAEWRRSYLRYAVSPALVSNPDYQNRYIAITDAEPGGAFNSPDLDEEPGETRSADQAVLDAITALRTEAALQEEPWQSLGATLVALQPVWTLGPSGDSNGAYHVPFCRKRDAHLVAETPMIMRSGDTSGGPRGTILVPSKGGRPSPVAIDVPLIVSIGGWRGEFRGAIACPGGGIDLVSVAPRERWEAAGLR